MVEGAEAARPAFELHETLGLLPIVVDKRGYFRPQEFHRVLVNARKSPQASLRIARGTVLELGS